jgi:hypothetical protein
MTGPSFIHSERSSRCGQLSWIDEVILDAGVDECQDAASNYTCTEQQHCQVDIPAYKNHRPHDGYHNDEPHEGEDQAQ